MKLNVVFLLLVETTKLRVDSGPSRVLWGEWIMLVVLLLLQKRKKSKFWQLQGCIVVQDFFRCSQLWKSIVRLVPKEPVLWAHPTLFTLMPWIGLILSCKKKNLLETPKKNLTKVHKSKKALKHRTVGSANVPVCAYIYIYIYIYSPKWSNKKGIQPDSA